MSTEAATRAEQALSLTVLKQLLEKIEMAPGKSFFDDGVLYYARVPDFEQLSKLRFLFGREISLRRSDPERVDNLLKYWRAELSPTFADEGDDLSSILVGAEDWSDLDSEKPVIQLVNHLFTRAFDLNASDIHFEPTGTQLEVRCRVDGIMTCIEKLPLSIQSAVLSRLKLMARMDIGEKRLPQDGRIDHRIGRRELDMRVSTLPGVYGESVVLRILDRQDLSIDLAALGMPEHVLRKYTEAVTQPHGLILITGPTGSGKTTTLYGTLEKITDEKRKVITVEDPVEYQLAGVTQIQVNAKIGLTFASGLRSIVRQDPDILMIGEIRDHETADIAIESALTGHLVFSTLHTNDAAGAVTRLQDMGIESYLITSSVLAVQAQRLIRRVCKACSARYPVTDDELAVLELRPDEITEISRGSGCEKCAGTGYKGRIGLYELLTMSNAVRHIINTGGDATQIREQAKKEGMTTLREDALIKLRDGLTTPEEVVRVTRLL
jgi:general secretion pathway protein E